MVSMFRAVSKTILGLMGSGHLRKVSPRNVVFISGCDSGLGFSLAVYCHSLNMTVISACHNLESKGARMLQSLSDPKRLIAIELDLLRPESIAHAQRRVAELLATPGDYEFTALVNNAGVMCFGEFEWQTPSQLELQINVNLLGTMRLTKELLPLVRQHRGRIINVTSHCALQALPSLSAYAASKGGLRNWNDALRIEMAQYGVSVINFIPGSFVMASNIAARQQEHAAAMLADFSEEQHSFYGAYFERFNGYLKVVSGFKGPNELNDVELLAKFEEALTCTNPRALYIHEPWRYKFYRILASICPTPIADWLMVRFCALPRYEMLEESATTAPVATAERK